MPLSNQVKSTPSSGHSFVKTDAPRFTGIGLVRSQGTLKELPFKWATAMSAALHVLGPVALAGFIALLLFLLSILLNINFWDWFKPKEKLPDVEFTIVQDTQAKKPEKAKLSGEFNQEAGGKKDPKKDISPMEKPSPATKAEQASPVQQAVKPQPQVPKTPPPAPPKKEVAQKQPQEQPQPQKPVEPPKPPVKKPMKAQTAPTPAFTPTIPIPIASALTGPPTPKMATPQGPISHQGSRSSSSGPVSIPSNGALASAASGHPGIPHASSMGGGAVGNPEEGPGKRPGVSVREADFGPYMSELKRRLTRNWKPPRGNETKRVVLKFEIGRDGRLLSLEVNRTSGEPLADEAAINAVKLSAPFRELPPEFQGQSVPILFTFDYTVYGNSAKFERVSR